MKILSICGSLRKNSSNCSILKAAQKVLEEVEWTSVDLSTLPYFDPDGQFSDNLPESVKVMRGLAFESDLIFISTPEYAHGIPGILKNGLEWLFHEGTQKKPVAFVVGSLQGEFAREQLLEVLRTMDFDVNFDRSLIIKDVRSKISTDGDFIDEAAEKEFVKFCQRLARSAY